ncbi:MAG: hypothetical protein KGS48_09380 [Bacteroidetes bacterium]|nr:hypothetical protein [Bacteroidota bacterium]
MKEKDQWIESVLASLEGMEKAPAPANLYEKLAARMQERPRAMQVRMSNAQQWMVAAGLAFLLFVNIITCLKNQPHFARNSDASSQLAKEYFSINQPFDL